MDTKDLNEDMLVDRNEWKRDHLCDRFDVILFSSSSCSLPKYLDKRLSCCRWM